MDYMAVYKNLLLLVDKAKIKEFPDTAFIIQEDALERIADPENEDEEFAFGLYTGQDRDDALTFEVMLNRRAFVVSCGGVLIANKYDEYETEEEAAQALFTTCKLLLNGQLRLLITYGRKSLLAAELFLVEGNKSGPINYHIETRKLQHSSKGSLHTQVIRNRVNLGVVELPPDFYLYDPKLAKVYADAGRTVDWAEPVPLNSKMLEKIGEAAIWHETSKKPRENIYLFALKQWETWVFTILCGALFIGLSIAMPDSRIMFQAFGASAFVFFVVYALPSLVKRKEARRKLRSRSTAR